MGPARFVRWPPSERKRGERGGKDARRVVHGERMQFLVHSKSRASAWTVILLSHEYMYIYICVCLLMDTRSKLSKLKGDSHQWRKGENFSPSKEWKRCCSTVLEKCASLERNDLRAERFEVL